MDEQLSELEKLQQAAQLIEEMSQGRLQVCPSVVGQVYIRPQHDSNLGMDMRIDSIPGQPHYRITFTVQLRRMGTDMVADDLRALLSEVGQTYALMAALEARRYTPTGEDLTAFRDGWLPNKDRNGREHPIQPVLQFQCNKEKKMKFNKQINNGTLLIPGGAFKISGFEGGEKVEIHTLDSAVVVLKKQMTTMELIQAMDALHRLATELTVHLARVCGTCDDCEDGCPFDDLEDGMLELPDYLREEAGIPAGAKLCVYVDDEEKTVTIAEAGYDHDLRDVPPYLLEMLGEAGICLGELEEQLMVGNLIYGERTACNGQEEHGDE